MSLAVPYALLLAGLAVPIILLYILKVRLRRVSVSTNLFWKQIYEEKPPRSIWQYLRHLLSLLLQLLLLALLVLAVADPYFPWQLMQARRVVAVIDNSASMQAMDVDPTRFDAAIESAISLVDGLRFRDQMAIVLAGPQPEVVLGMSSHLPTLKRALLDLRVSDNPTELEGAIQLGKKLVGDHPRGQVVVFTDGCEKTQRNQAQDTNAEVNEQQGAASPTATQIDSETGQIPSVDYRVFGTRLANVGIAQFQVRRSLIDPIGYEILVDVFNASDETVKCRLELELDGAPVDIVPLTLAPNERWSRSLEKTSLEGGQLVGRLQRFEADRDDAGQDSPDSSRGGVTTEQLNGLAADDLASAILPARELQNVLIVSQGNLFLRKVFEANPLVSVEVVPEFPDVWPDASLIVLDREVPEQLPEGNVFVVDPAGSCDLWDLGEPLQDPIVTEQDTDSPLMKHVRLDNVIMPEARRVVFKGKTHTLAGSLSNDPVYAEVYRDSSKCLMLTVNLDRSDLAFRTAFPIMVTNALGWFAGTSGELSEASETGQVIRFDTEKLNATDVVSLRSPSEKESPVSWQPEEEAETTLLSLGPLDECGVWTLFRRTGETATEVDTLADFAVNLSDVAETDLRPPAEFTEESVDEPMMANLFARPVWFYLLLLGCCLSVAEWFWYQRRMIS